MLEDEIDVHALPVMSQIAFAEGAAAGQPVGIGGGVDIGHLAPAIEIAAADDTLMPQRHDEVALDSSEMTPIALVPAAAQNCTLMEPSRPRRPRPAHSGPYRRICGDGRTACDRRWRASACSRRFLPQVRCFGRDHQLAALHPAELREGTVRRLIAPDALAEGENIGSPPLHSRRRRLLIAVDDHTTTQRHARYRSSPSPVEGVARTGLPEPGGIDIA